MKEIEIGGVKVDFSEACGGVWFDIFELRKFDEVHESAGEELIDLMAKHQSDGVDLSQRLKSPRHPEMIMMRRFFSSKRQIEIDECPMCGGVWLDAGELARIRELFPTEEKRKRAGREFVEEFVRGAGYDRMVAESEENRAKAQRFANLFRWLCPSNYIPGKQEWGAFW